MLYLATFSLNGSAAFQQLEMILVSRRMFPCGSGPVCLAHHFLLTASSSSSSPPCPPAVARTRSFEGDSELPPAPSFAVETVFDVEAAGIEVSDAVRPADGIVHFRAEPLAGGRWETQAVPTREGDVCRRRGGRGSRSYAIRGRLLKLC